MKHFFKTIAMFCLGACTMASCGDEETPTKQENPKLEVSKSELGFSKNVESKVVTITTNSTWYVENNSDWITVSPMGGKGNGAITVSVSQNASGQSRESYFSVAIDSDSKVIVVSQSATDTPAEGGGGNSLTVKPVLNAMAVEDITPHTAGFSDLLAVTGAVWYKIGSDSKIGFCLGTSSNPTIENNSVYEESVSEEGEFGYTFMSLNPGTTYYVRSYAVVTLTDINSNTNTEIVYGIEKSFTTPVVNGSYSYSTGAIAGYFSIGANSKVAFSMGNLQYKASTNTWRFAENQYDIIGVNNSNISSTYSDYIDLFGWGTSGYNGEKPYMTSQDYSDYGVVGDIYADIAGTNYDWGVYNKISNGGNAAGQWRTLTYDEWDYVLSERTDASALKGLATVNGVTGMVLLPDNWTTPSDITFTSGMNGFSNNTYTTSEWAKMEANGAVFLPAAGRRTGSDVDYVGSDGWYWSSSASRDNGYGYLYAYHLLFISDLAFMSDYGYRYGGLSVRLVRGL